MTIPMQDMLLPLRVEEFNRGSTQQRGRTHLAKCADGCEQDGGGGLVEGIHEEENVEGVTCITEYSSINVDAVMTWR